MKVAITGATGFVGREVLPLLARSADEVVLFGRTKDDGNGVTPYDEMPSALSGCAVLLHLAAANNDKPHPPHHFNVVNVDFARHVVEQACAAGVDRIIYVSSTHALDEANTMPYAVSKRQGAAVVSNMADANVDVVHLPLVYGDRWGGRMQFLNGWPRPVATKVFKAFAALKPTVHVSMLAEYVLQPRRVTADDVILFDDQDRNPAYWLPKAMMDVGASLAILVLFWWVLAIVGLAVRMDSPGPALFRQARVGRNNKMFTCYKFRTMTVGTPQVGTHEVSAAAITKVGAFLRRTKLDELPQVINILRNEMSLVGPRPCLPVQVELVAERQKRGVDRIKPGITGLAQVNSIDMSDPVKLAQWDARYLALRSLLLDVKILIRTALGGGSGDAVRR